MIDALSERELLADLRAARARARWRAWELGAARERIVLDLVATLITAHSDKQQAAGNWKGGYGFHPMLCYLDGSQEALAGILSPGTPGQTPPKTRSTASSWRSSSSQPPRSKGTSCCSGPTPPGSATTCSTTCTIAGCTSRWEWT